MKKQIGIGIILLACLIVGAGVLWLLIEKDKVELDIFSGVPNPTWTLTLMEGSNLKSMISKLNATEIKRQRPENLGYRGFIIQTTTALFGDKQTIRAYHGIVEVEDATKTVYYLDPQRQIEFWLLSTAKTTLTEDLTSEIIKEIKKDEP
ncbi:MAG: hypothetical protein WCI88_08935 [Chloroflexota bacterium]